MDENGGAPACGRQLVDLEWRRATRGSFVGRTSWRCPVSPNTNGRIIATEPRRTPARTPTGAPRKTSGSPRTISASRAAAVPRKTPSARPAVRRPRPVTAAPYRPKYWLVGLLVAVLLVLAVTFLTAVAILWSLAGPVATVVMVMAYAAVMYVLYRLGVNRL